MKKILATLLILLSTQALAEILIEEYPKALQGTWEDRTTESDTALTFFESPQAIRISSGDCAATGRYELQIAVDIPEKSSCWKFECFQMDITITETKGGEACEASYPVDQHLYVNMRLKDENTLLFGEDLVFSKQ